MTAPVLVRDLVKTFGSTRGLDGLELEVEQGEVHGFLGPNGSGKSTTIRILLGLLRPDSGTARLFGGDPWRDAVDLHRRLSAKVSSRPDPARPPRHGGSPARWAWRSDSTGRR